MTALEQIERLKATRRAELKAAEDERKQAEDARHTEAVRTFKLALGKWLREVNAEWLVEYHTDTVRNSECEYTAVFTVPDHAPLMVAFGHGGGLQAWHAIAYASGKWEVRGQRFMRLDDALILAEGVANIPL